MNKKLIFPLMIALISTAIRSANAHANFFESTRHAIETKAQSAFERAKEGWSDLSPRQRTAIKAVVAAAVAVAAIGGGALILSRKARAKEKARKKAEAKQSFKPLPPEEQIELAEKNIKDAQQLHQENLDRQYKAAIELMRTRQFTTENRDHLINERTQNLRDEKEKVEKSKKILEFREQRLKELQSPQERKSEAERKKQQSEGNQGFQQLLNTL